jgi:hypothetical protein
MARQAGVAVGVLAGSVEISKEEYQGLGIAGAIAARKKGMPLEYAIANGGQLLTEAAAEFAREYLAAEK